MGFGSVPTRGVADGSIGCLSTKPMRKLEHSRPDALHQCPPADASPLRRAGPRTRVPTYGSFRSVMICPHAAHCPLYEQFRLPGVLAVWKTVYCEGNFETCERYKLSSRAKPVPLLLLPNGKLLNHAVK